MKLFEMIASAQNGRVFANLGHRFGLTERQSANLVYYMAPPIAAGFYRNVQTQEGLIALLHALGSGRHADYYDNPKIFSSVSVRDDGVGILMHVLGSDFARYQVTLNASRASAVDFEIAERILPYVAALSMSALYRKSQLPLGHLVSRVLYRSADRITVANPFEPLAQYIATGGRLPLKHSLTFRSLSGMLGSLFAKQSEKNALPARRRSPAVQPTHNL